MQHSSSLGDEMNSDQNVVCMDIDQEMLASREQKPGGNDEDREETLIDCKKPVVDDEMQVEVESDVHVEKQVNEIKEKEIENDGETQEQNSCRCSKDNASSGYRIPDKPDEGRNFESLFSRDELIDFFEKLKLRKCPEKDKIMIGMVGFPNVGKSSTINALLGNKKTSVSSTPGKTKHFQVICSNSLPYIDQFLHMFVSAVWLCLMRNEMRIFEL